MFYRFEFLTVLGLDPRMLVALTENVCLPPSELRSMLLPLALLAAVFRLDIKLLVNVLKRGNGDEYLLEL